MTFWIAVQNAKAAEWKRVLRSLPVKPVKGLVRSAIPGRADLAYSPRSLCAPPAKGEANIRKKNATFVRVVAGQRQEESWKFVFQIHSLHTTKLLSLREAMPGGRIQEISLFILR